MPIRCYDHKIVLYCSFKYAINAIPRKSANEIVTFTSARTPSTESNTQLSILPNPRQRHIIARQLIFLELINIAELGESSHRILDYLLVFILF